jgi:hypothetical protein
MDTPEPDIVSFPVGIVVPIPTLPLLSILTFSPDVVPAG